MGHGLKVARVNKVFQIEDELTQTGFEEARPAPVEEDDQVDGQIDLLRCIKLGHLPYFDT